MMSKIKTFKISIPEPCNEGWSNMQPNKSGRFCSSCEKTVVDFTKMTDNEIVKMITRSKEDKVKICGHFKKTQVDRRMMESVPYKSRPSGFMIAAALLTGLSFLSCQAQEVNYHKVGKVEMVKGDVAMESVDTNVQVIRFLDGYSDIAVTGVNVTIEGEGYEKMTYISDKQGRVNIKRLGALKNLNFVITHPLYDRKEYSFTFGENKILNVRMTESIMIDGMVEGEMEIIPEEIEK